MVLCRVMLEPEAEGQTSNTGFLEFSSVGKLLPEKILKDMDTIKVEIF